MFHKYRSGHWSTSTAACATWARASSSLSVVAPDRADQESIKRLRRRRTRRGFASSLFAGKAKLRLPRAVSVDNFEVALSNMLRVKGGTGNDLSGDRER